MQRDPLEDGQVAEDHLRADGEGEPAVAAHRAATFSTRDRRCRSGPTRCRPARRPRARRASSPVTAGARPLADRVGELDELGGVGVAEQLDVTADGLDVPAGARVQRQGGAGRVAQR